MYIHRIKHVIEIYLVFLFYDLFSNMKDNDEVVENICILFSELVEYGR